MEDARRASISRILSKVMDPPRDFGMCLRGELFMGTPQIDPTLRDRHCAPPCAPFDGLINRPVN